MGLTRFYKTTVFLHLFLVISDNFLVYFAASRLLTVVAVRE